jgi:tetratricopeptide (TPR) repeat protein
MEQSQDLLDEAIRHHELGNLEQAAPLYERLLRVDPGHPEALLHLGKLEVARSNAAVGADLLQRAASTRPDVADVHQNLGVAYKQLKRWGDAARSFEQAIALNPRHAASYFELADLSQTLGDLDAAINFYLRTINLDSSNTEAFRRLGDLLYERQNWVGAENCFARVVDTGILNSDRGALLALLNKLGMTFIRQEKLTAAAEVFRKILGIAPEFVEMYSNLAYVYERQGQLEEALAAGLRAVELKPEFADAHNNLGIVCRSLHRLDDARHCFMQAIALNPEFALAQFNLGSVNLMQGNYPAGWRGYEWRGRTLSAPPRQFSAPAWDGRPIPGRRLLVHTEQGYGDTILFARFLRAAQVRSGATVILEGPAALLPLLRSVAGVDQVIRAGTPLPPFDFQIPLPSLAGLLGVDSNALPGDVPYLETPGTCLAAWRTRIAGADQDGRRNEPLRIGIVWTGNPGQDLNARRSCQLAHFARLAAVPGTAWYCLQKEVDQEGTASDWPEATRITALGPMLHDFADTAAVIEALDLVISVDTSVAHLAGALGRPAWVLLPHTPDWRWQLDRTDSAWYPTMRLFRQPRRDDWNAVFESVEAALRKMSSERRCERI